MECEYIRPTVFVQHSRGKIRPLSWDSLVFWSMEKGVCLKKSDPGYPEALEILMGEDAPSSLWTRGALPILDRPVVAIFCSQSCTGLAATRAYDVVQALSLINISEPTRPRQIAYAVFCLRR